MPIGDITLRGVSSPSVLSDKGQLTALEQQVSVLQLNCGTNAGTAQNATQTGTPAPEKASTNSETTIILPSLINEPDARLKGTEELMDHLEEELFSQIKVQPDTSMQS